MHATMHSQIQIFLALTRFLSTVSNLNRQNLFYSFKPVSQDASEYNII